MRLYKCTHNYLSLLKKTAKRTQETEINTNQNVKNNKRVKKIKIKKRKKKNDVGKCSVCQQRKIHPKYKKVPSEK